MRSSAPPARGTTPCRPTEQWRGRDRAGLRSYFRAACRRGPERVASADSDGPLHGHGEARSSRSKVLVRCRNAGSQREEIPVFGPQATAPRSQVVGRIAAAVASAVTVIALLVVAAPARAAIPQFTPISASVLAVPQPVSATDGRRHVVYELLVRNTTEVSVEVQSLAVRARGRTLLTFAGADLTAVMSTAQSFTSTLASGEGATVWLDLVVRHGRRVPVAIVHRFNVRATSPSGES